MKVLLTDPAKRRLKDIFQYYRKNVSERIAEKITNKILDDIQILETMPYAGAEEEYLKQLLLEHRRIVSGNYKVIYRIAND
ncbi:MAG: type II toxin-antitoxin system RelE/ParE family toxin [Chitinophagales bacterium]|nr:type II toxin-antitoxin system RelE/ParE family toxin [Chitinophagales bacterium]